MRTIDSSFARRRRPPRHAGASPSEIVRVVKPDLDSHTRRPGNFRLTRGTDALDLIGLFL